MPDMEQLISDIEAHCARFGITPQKLLRDVINARWGQWDDWKAGVSSPTMKVADRLRAHMEQVSVAHISGRGERYPTRQDKAPKKQGAA